MRVLALCGLLAVATQLSLCERRNPALCSLDPGFECEDGKFCSIPTGQSTGTCVQSECTAANNTCSSDQPLCLNGKCSRCENNPECQALNPSTPICSSGLCVACAVNSDCSSATSPICDTASHSCRACQAHSDCSGTGMSGVCAKDETFANLSTTDTSLNIPKGSCVPVSKVNVVDPSCVTGSCSLQTEINMVSLQRPYVRVGSVSSSTGLPITMPALPSGLPTFYIVGATADLAPSRTIPVQPSTIANTSGQALVIPAGSHTIIEGMVIGNTTVGVECQSDGVTSTRVKLLRSLVGSCTTTGVKAGKKCELSLDSTWIGKGPTDPQLTSYKGNPTALQLDSTQLEMLNSVIWHNNFGITLSDSGGLNPLVRIVNSTFSGQIIPNANKVLVIDCTYATGGKMSIINSLFANATGPGTGNTYVHGNCRQGASPLAGVASNDTMNLTCPTCVADSSITDSIFISTAGDLHLAQSAPTTVTAGGVAQFTDLIGQVTIPGTDMDGASRGQSIAIGAFDTAP